jgi:cholesterol 24(S)-hydroxylase
MNYKKEYKKIIEKLRLLGRQQIENRLKLMQEGSYIPQDLLTITLKSYENESFDMEDMIDDFITFFIAGQETTGFFKICF